MRSGQLGKPGHGTGREIYKFSYRRSHPWDSGLMGRAGYRYEVPRSSLRAAGVGNSFRVRSHECDRVVGIDFPKEGVWSRG